MYAEKPNGGHQHAWEPASYSAHKARCLSSPRQGAKGLEDSWTDADVQATLIGQRSLCMVSVKDGSRATHALSSKEGKQVGYTFPLGLLTIARYCPLWGRVLFPQLIPSGNALIDSSRGKSLSWSQIPPRWQSRATIAPGHQNKLPSFKNKNFKKERKEEIGVGKDLLRR